MSNGKSAPMPWFVRGDIDGFFGLALDNFVQLLLIRELCKEVLHFNDALLYGRVLPGAAVSILLGNLFYAWQARKLSEQTGRKDICALPYGINTVSLFAHVFLVMLPARGIALDAGATPDDASLAAWRAGLAACFGSGAIEFAGAFFAERIRKSTPRAALLSTLAGIAIPFISLSFVFQTYAHPIVGLATLGIILLAYFGRVRFKGGLPSGLVAVIVGVILAKLTGIHPAEAQQAEKAFYPPVPVIGDFIASFQPGYWARYISVIVPMGLFNLIGSLQNIESAEAAGDLYQTRPSLIVNGCGSIAAALFGSCFPTTIYIGHPGWKAMGARAGYSVLNGVVITIVCLTGALAFLANVVPIDAGMAIVLWIGIVIAAQAFQAVPREHAPAVVIGLLPGIAAWGALMIKASLRVAGYSFSNDPNFLAKTIDAFQTKEHIWLNGAFALETGFIFTAMILSAATVAVIERKFRAAAAWCAAAAGLSLTGLMHSYVFAHGDTAIQLKPAYEWAIGYAIMAAVFFAAEWVTVEGEGH
ncbi:MAG TPA: NCS2 family permease [Planctomycetota bacterium]|nr:NCS2 family permease [Planctomycetota bacterium]